MAKLSGKRPQALHRVLGPPWIAELISFPESGDWGKAPKMGEAEIGGRQLRRGGRRSPDIHFIK